MHVATLTRATVAMHTFNSLSGDVCLDRWSIADCESMNTESVCCSFDQVPNLQPSLPTAFHIHCHQFTHSCEVWGDISEEEPSCEFLAVCMYGHTLYRSSGLIDDSVAIQLPIGNKWSSPGHIDARSCHFREWQVAWLTGSCKTWRMISKMELQGIKEDQKIHDMMLIGLVLGDCNILVSYLTAGYVPRGGHWVARHQQCWRQ